MFVLAFTLVSAYIAPSPTNVNFQLNNSYTAPIRTAVNFVLGESGETPPPEDPCVYSGPGSFLVNCSYNCDFVNTNLLGNDVIISGSGFVQNISNLENASRIRLEGGCRGRV